mmetsp:Transcript_31241/g.33553  ORF Transcript_31241/g.33553 Transcript_31241/m.33553 type:complete len:228 (-) Transcript_31241:208-891(-)
MGEICNPLLGCLEVNHVNRIEPHEGHIEPEIHPSEVLARQEGNSVDVLFFQMSFESFQGDKELRVGFFVGLLGLGKSAPVDTVVDGRINVLVELLGFFPFLFLEELALGMVCEFIKGAVQDLEDVQTFVADNCLFFLAPQDGCGILSSLILRQFVQVSDRFGAIDRIRDQGVVAVKTSMPKCVCEGLVTWIFKMPAGVGVIGIIGLGWVPGRMDNGISNCVIETLVL